LISSFYIRSGRSYQPALDWTPSFDGEDALWHFWHACGGGWPRCWFVSDDVHDEVSLVVDLSDVIVHRLLLLGMFSFVLSITSHTVTYRADIW